MTNTPKIAFVCFSFQYNIYFVIDVIPLLYRKLKKNAHGKLYANKCISSAET